MGGIGKKYDSGNQGSDYNFRIRILKLLSILTGTTGISACCPPQVEIPSYVISTVVGSVAAGKRSVSVYNSGNANGVWLGQVIKPGVQLTYAATLNNTLGAFTYSGVGTELVITTLT